jgi:hypothetical protein
MLWPETEEDAMKSLPLLAAIGAALSIGSPDAVSAMSGGEMLAMAQKPGEHRPPKTKDWAAWENRMPQIGGTGPTLYVTGKVKVPGTQYKPVLTPAAPQGINPKILLLNLSIEGQGDAQGGESWRDVRYEQPVAAGQYVQVSILFQGSMIDNLDVTIAQ